MKDLTILLSYFLAILVIWLIVKIKEINEINFRLYLKKYLYDMNPGISELERAIIRNEIIYSDINVLQKKYFRIFISYNLLLNNFKIKQNENYEKEDLDLINKNKKLYIKYSIWASFLTIVMIVLMVYGYKN